MLGAPELGGSDVIGQCRLHGWLNFANRAADSNNQPARFCQQ